MSRGRIAWIVAPLLLGLAGCGGSKSKAMAPEYPDFLKPLANATDITLYSIDGVDESRDHPVPRTDEKFFGYPVLGKMTVDAETRDAIVRELDRSTRNDPHFAALLLASACVPRRRWQEDGRLCDLFPLQLDQGHRRGECQGRRRKSRAAGAPEPPPGGEGNPRRPLIARGPERSDRNGSMTSMAGLPREDRRAEPENRAFRMTNEFANRRSNPENRSSHEHAN